MRGTNTSTRDDAEELALVALAFLADDGQRLGRFLQLTGLSPDRLLADAGQASTLIAVLEHLASDESLLLVFATTAGIDPGRISPAIEVLRSDTGDRK